MTTITEIIPDREEWPDWAKEAFDSGQFFNVVDEKLKQMGGLEQKWFDAGIIWAAAFMIQSHKEESYAKDILLHGGVDMKNGVDYDVDIIKKAKVEK